MGDLGRPAGVAARRAARHDALRPARVRAPGPCGVAGRDDRGVPRRGSVERPWLTVAAYQVAPRLAPFRTDRPHGKLPRMALGDGIRRNIAQVDPPSARCSATRSFEINQRSFPGHGPTVPRRAACRGGSSKTRSTRRRTCTEARSSFPGTARSSIASRRAAANQPAAFTALLGLDSGSSERSRTPTSAAARRAT